MTHWSLYWPDWLVARTLETGTPSVVHGGWNQNTRPLKNVEPGDLLFITAGSQGQIHLLGGLRIEGSGSAHSGSPHSCSTSHVSGSPLADFRIDRTVPFPWLSDWTFRNADGTDRSVPITPQLGRLAKTHAFQGCYRLTRATGERLLQLFHAPPNNELLSPDPVLRELEVRRVAQPTDEELARVHMDALLERGDPRGTVIALELAGAHQGRRTERRSLLKHVDAHPSILGRPGGFPYRMGWGLPKKLRA